MPDLKILAGVELESNAINTLRSQLSGIKDVVLKVDKIEISSAALNNLKTQLSSANLSGLGQTMGQQLGNGINQGARSGISNTEKAISNINRMLSTNGFSPAFAGVDAQLKKVGESSKYLDQNFQNALNTLNGFRGFDWTSVTGNPERATAAWGTFNTSLATVRNSLTAAAREQSTLVNGLERIRTISSMEAWLSKNSAASARFGDQIRNIITQLKTADRTQFNNLKNQFAIVKDQAEALNMTGRSFSSEMKNMFSKFSSWFSVATVVMQSIRGIKQMISDVHAIDTALTDLYKVTDNTSSQYAQFFKEASANAKEYGSTIKDMISSTADFARLGYSLQEASSLASIANIYKNVGDISVEDGTKSIISTMKAFKFEAEDAIVIVDKFNEVGNNFAISSAGIGDSLQRSASSLAAAGNDINQAIGMITAANTVVQDPESVGTALKTISMRIRGAATELEEAGLDTEGMVTSVSKLREEILALSGVDILIDADTFKSTYDILDELSVKWKDLTDIQRANNRCLYVQKCA